MKKNYDDYEKTERIMHPASSAIQDFVSFTTTHKQFNITHSLLIHNFCSSILLEYKVK